MPGDRREQYDLLLRFSKGIEHLMLLGDVHMQPCHPLRAAISIIRDDTADRPDPYPPAVPVLHTKLCPGRGRGSVIKTCNACRHLRPVRRMNPTHKYIIKRCAQLPCLIADDMRPAAVNRQCPPFHKGIPETDTCTLLCHPDMLKCPAQPGGFCRIREAPKTSARKKGRGYCLRAGCGTPEIPR
ncbi:hypothetical protein MKMG_00990 [Methanogenium sp. MK-MG]|nr:hypothetical protein MKMG_00990 [Methanogenium sp. MK-MG]